MFHYQYLGNYSANTSTHTVLGLNNFKSALASPNPYPNQTSNIQNILVNGVLANPFHLKVCEHDKLCYFTMPI